MEKKNPLLAGLINAIVPGAGYWYVDQDRGRFIKTLVAGGVAIVAMTGLGVIIQRTTGFPFPPGLCIGILLLPVFVILFRNGQKAASHRNFVLDNADMYTIRQHGTSDAQLARIQRLRDKGLISEQEFNSRRDNIASKP